MAVTYKINQYNTVIDSVFAQATGVSNISSATTDGLVSMGDKILSSDTDKDAFFKELSDRFTRVQSMVESWEPNPRAIYKRASDFGNAIQMLTFEAGTNSLDSGWAGVNSWDGTTRGQQGNPFTNTVNTTVKQYIFSARAGWEFDDVISDLTIKTGFASQEALATFIGGIYMTHQNKMKEDVANAGNLAVNRAMVECYKKANAASGANTALFENVLARYNLDVLGLTCTIADGAIVYPDGWVLAERARYDKGFLRYLSQVLSLDVERFSDITSVYNIAGHNTQAKNVQLEVHNDIASACAYYLESDTFHNDLVALKGYNPIVKWQGSKVANKDAYDFAATSSIYVADSTKKYNLDGIVAFMYDDMAVMQTIDDYRSKSLYNPKDEVLNTYDKANLAFAILPFKNMKVYQIANPTIKSGAVDYHVNGLATVANV